MPQAPFENILHFLLRACAASSGSQLTDRQLLDRFQSLGEETVFTFLIQRHGRMVYSVAQRTLGNAQDAEDVFQATFLVMARRLHALGGEKSVGGWLHGVAWRIARKARAKAATRRRHERELPFMKRTEADHEAPTCDEMRVVLDVEIGALAEKYRAPLVLCYLEGRSYDQAARELGCPKSTLASRLSKALGLLRGRLQRRGIGLTATALTVKLSEMAEAAPVSAVLTANTVKAAALAAVGKGMAEGYVTASALLLAKDALAGLVWVKMVVMMAVVMGLALGGVGWAEYAASPAQRNQQPEARVQPEAPARDALAGAPGSEPRVDMHGDPLPKGAVSRLGTLRFNHGGRLNSLLFTPDGATIVSEGSGIIRTWDAASGKELREIRTGESTWDDQSVLLADGKRLMTLRQEFPADTIRVWSLADGKEVATVPLPVRRGGHDVWHRNALSPDGRYCAVSMPKQIRVFEIATAKELWTLPNAEFEKGTLVTFAGNDKLVTADHNSVVQLRDAATGKIVRELNVGSKVGVLATTIDGARLATLEHHNRAIDRYLDKDVVHIWDLASGKEVQTLAAPPKSWFMRLRFAPDGNTLFTSWYTENTGYKASGWNLATGKQLTALEDDFPQALSPDGRFAAIGGAKFDLLNLSNNASGGFADAKSAWARDVFLSSAGAVTSGHSSISSWDVNSGRRSHSTDIPPYLSSLPRAAHSPDGRYAAIFEGDYQALRILIWDVAARQALHTLRPPGANQNSKVSFSPDSARVAIYQPNWLKEGAVTIWDIATGKELRTFKEPKTFAGHSGAPYFTVDSKTLVVAGRNVVGLAIATGQELYTWRMERSPSSFGLKTDAGGKSADQEDPSAWRALAISSDGAVAGGILWGEDVGNRRTENRIVLCDGRTGRILGRMDDSGKATPDFEAVSFSPDGRLLATTDNAVVHLWEVATRKEIRRLEGHRGDVASVSFSLNGRRLATSSGDSTCLIWDMGRIVDADQPLAKPAAAKQIAAWWDDLLSAEPRTAYAAIWRLSEAPKEAVPFLSERLRPVPKEQANQIAKYVTDLESDRFPVRQKASQELHALGRMIEPALRRALEKNPQLETRRRLEQLLNDVYNGPTAGEPLRTVRALAVLEYAATPEAKQLLETLARGADGAFLTEETRQALERLKLQSRTRS
jgi:RNA polymerase sigma factor (sigma-70 family)